MTEPQEKPKSKMWIVGANIAVMLLYSLMCYATGGDGIIFMWIIMLIHVGISFLAGIGTAISNEYKASALPWFLSSIAILLIGLSTCFMAVSGLGHM